MLRNLPPKPIGFGIPSRTSEADCASRYQTTKHPRRVSPPQPQPQLPQNQALGLWSFEGRHPQDICGSKTYLPPEVRNDDLRENYTRAVDIWSLGVVLLRYAYALPYPGSGMGMKWCEQIVEAAHDWHSEGLIDILQHMLVIEPKERLSTTDCLRAASRLLSSSQDRSTTPTPAPCTAGYGATMARSPEGQEPEEQETLRISPRDVCMP